MFAAIKTAIRRMRAAVAEVIIMRITDRIAADAFLQIHDGDEGLFCTNLAARFSQLRVPERIELNAEAACFSKHRASAEIKGRGNLSRALAAFGSAAHFSNVPIGPFRFGGFCVHGVAPQLRSNLMSR